MFLSTLKLLSSFILFTAACTALYANTVVDGNTSVTLLETGALSVVSGAQTWTQNVLSEMTVSEVVVSGKKINYTLDSYSVALTLSGNTIAISISGDNESDLNSLDYPFPFTSPDLYSLVMPMNEGFLVPVDEIEALYNNLAFYGSFGCSLNMFGLTNLSNGYMGIVETPYDASLQTAEYSGNAASYVSWVGQKGKLGYARKLKFYFYAYGDYVDMAKDYRQWSDDNGYTKTLSEKLDEDSRIRNLLGAYNIYTGNGLTPLSVVSEIKQYLVKNALLSSTTSLSQANEIWERRYLTSKYEIYQDSWDEETPLSHRGGYDPGTSNYTGYGYVKLTGYDSGDSQNTTYWKKGYTHPTYGQSYSVCRSFAESADIDDSNNLMMKYLVNSYKESGYLDSLFMDTEVGTTLQECYDPNHPTTRTSDMETRKRIAQYHLDNGFLYGTEQGAWWMVKEAHYFEGMWTIVKWWTVSPTAPPSENYLKYQTGYGYRIPLFQLVYHDCVVCYNRWDDRLEQFGDWNDYSDMKRKIAWFSLYGIAPLSRVTADTWAAVKDTMMPLVRENQKILHKVAGKEMINHEFLTEDKSIQRTTWEGGHVITVNFSDNSVQINSPGQLIY